MKTKRKRDPEKGRVREAGSNPVQHLSQESKGKDIRQRRG